MVVQTAKSLIKKGFNTLGIEIQKKKSAACQEPRTSMYGCLNQAIQNGLNPATVIDVGAATGTPPLYKLFPNARHLLIEPLEENIPALDDLVGKLDKAEYIIAAAGTKQGNITINVHPDLVGSSIYKEEEDSNVNGTERIVPVVTIDQVCEDRKTESPYLIKIDTQGSELEVLMGAENILKETEFIILESSLFQFFEEGFQIFEYISFMKDRGFVVYDIFDLQYRLLDGAMSQVDIAFVKEKSNFRQYHFYATREQREAQNKYLMKSNKN